MFLLSLNKFKSVDVMCDLYSISNGVFKQKIVYLIVMNYYKNIIYKVFYYKNIYIY